MLIISRNFSYLLMCKKQAQNQPSVMNFFSVSTFDDDDETQNLENIIFFFLNLMST